MSRLLKKIQATQQQAAQRIILCQRPQILKKRMHARYTKTIFIYVSALFLGSLLAFSFLKNHTTSIQNTPLFSEISPSTDEIETVVKPNYSPLPTISIEPLTWIDNPHNFNDETYVAQIPLRPITKSSIAETVKPSLEDQNITSNQLSETVDNSPDNPTLTPQQALPLFSNESDIVTVTLDKNNDTTAQTTHEISNEISTEKSATQSLQKIDHQQFPIHLISKNLKPLWQLVHNEISCKHQQITQLITAVNNNLQMPSDDPTTNTHLTLKQQAHLNAIYHFLKKFRIDGVRINGTQSRIQANGYAYHVNTLVSHRPFLKLTGITNNEIIFKDEYNQEYRKEISQNN